MENGQRSGYQVKEKSLTLDFTGGEYEGAEVRLRLNVPLRTVFEIQKLGLEGKDEAVIQELGTEVLLDWNLQRKDGTAIPATAEGLLEMPSDFGMLVLKQWTEALKGDESPLGGTSPNGSTSEAPTAVTESA